MAGLNIEVILNRQLADCLSVPVFIVSPDGVLVFYNEPAEQILGRRFEDTGELPAEKWSTMFTPMDDDGNPIPQDKLPLVIALTKHIPAHKSFWIKSLDGHKHKISVTSYPIIGRSKKFAGAVAIFWANNEES